MLHEPIVHYSVYEFATIKSPKGCQFSLLMRESRFFISVAIVDETRRRNALEFVLPKCNLRHLKDKDVYNTTEVDVEWRDQPLFCYYPNKQQKSNGTCTVSSSLFVSIEKAGEYSFQFRLPPTKVMDRTWDELIGDNNFSPMHVHSTASSQPSAFFGIGI